jgi:hypothetical protein
VLKIAAQSSSTQIYPCVISSAFDNSLPTLTRFHRYTGTGIYVHTVAVTVNCPNKMITDAYRRTANLELRTKPTEMNDSSMRAGGGKRGRDQDGRDQTTKIVTCGVYSPSSSGARCPSDNLVGRDGPSVPASVPASRPRGRFSRKLAPRTRRTSSDLLVSTGT